MRTGKDRVAAEAFNEPIQLADIRVEPGDWLVGDTDGVVVVPAVRVVEVLTAAEQIAGVEDRIRAAVAEGKPLAETRQQVGYHDLQARTDRPGG
jgi:regulator of RNase E activity RraA